MVIKRKCVMPETTTSIRFHEDVPIGGNKISILKLFGHVQCHARNLKEVLFKQIFINRKKTKTVS